MRGGTRARIALVVLLLLAAGSGAYWGGRHLWGVYHYHAAEEALARRDFRLAASHLGKCLDVSPGDLTWRLTAAQTARREGEFAQALDHLTAYQQGGGSEQTVTLERKLVIVQRGDLTQADALLASCKEHPEAPETPLMLEAVIQGTENYLKGGPAADLTRSPQHETQSRRAIEQWLRLRPGPADQVRGLLWRAYLHTVGGDRPQAVADLRKAVAIDPDNFDARLELARSLGRTDPAEAAEHLEVLRRRDPTNNDVRFPLALMRRSLGQLDEATQLLDQVLASAPDDVPALVARGQVALDLQQLGQAEELLRRAWNLEPDEPETNLTLSRCLKLLDRPEEAKTYEDRFAQLKAERSRSSMGPPR
jgi:tetratricopeptide (TPR) repeat protein